MASDKKNKTGAGRSVTATGAAGEPRPAARGLLSDQTAQIGRMEVTTSRVGSTKGQELRRSMIVGVFGSDGKGQAQMFTAAAAESRDRGKTWTVRDYVRGGQQTVTGGTRAVKKVLTDIGNRPYRKADAERARDRQYGGQA